MVLHCYGIYLGLCNLSIFLEFSTLNSKYNEIPNVLAINAFLISVRPVNLCSKKSFHVIADSEFIDVDTELQKHVN